MMAGKTDARGVLEAEPFGWSQHQDGKVFITYEGRQVMILRGDAAKRLVLRLEDADARAVQLALAKVTGNFKRGNEKGR